MATQVNLNFHQTFKPEKQYLSSILEIANSIDELTVQEISSCTGIPNGKSSGKVEPHIFYAQYMGLIDVQKDEGKYRLTKTALGNVVYLEDPGLQENLSILLCHAMMARNTNGASIWNTVFTKIFPDYRGCIKRDLLYMELEKTYEGKANKKNIAPFISSYEDYFANLDLIDIKTDYLSVNVLSYNKEYVYLYALILFELWDEMYSSQDEISSVQLRDLCFGRIFGWNEETEYSVLEHLSDRNLIRMNRQLYPYTILRTSVKSDLIEKLYSELC